jgi:hypothetical protein
MFSAANDVKNMGIFLNKFNPASFLNTNDLAVNTDPSPTTILL